LICSFAISCDKLQQAAKRRPYHHFHPMRHQKKQQKKTWKQTDLGSPASCVSKCPVCYPFSLSLSLSLSLFLSFSAACLLAFYCVPRVNEFVLKFDSLATFLHCFCL